ncbi:hypothetical protein [Flavobacterium algicola]|uniref:hypothetical protein n=1 Tax=Flavobacterium algicola TaxID=556529 RepID=UPI001EFC965C|nr:hypothetical protein [Flavobacterium algicola]MCG9791154.1 hypothetical protein [Flavobacterium algicola]
MMKLEKPTAKIKFGIDYFIQEQCDVLNMTNVSFLDKLAISNEQYHTIIESKEVITEEFATKLATLFTTSTHYWINIDQNYKDWLKKRIDNCLTN